MSADTIVRYGNQSAKVNMQQRDINLALEKIMGWEPYSTTVIQGCESTSVGASGGTHAYKQSEDLTPNEEKDKEKFLRILGQMHYIRPAIKGVWPRHNHGGVDWTSNGGPAFMAQLRDYHLRLNALANRGPDAGYHMLVYPKNIYGGYIGYVQATVNTYAWEQQTAKSHRFNAIVKNQITYVVAETEVSGQRWYVTLTGKCIKAANFKKIAKPVGATPEHPDVHPIKVVDKVQKYTVSKAPAYGRVGPGVSGVAKIQKSGKDYALEKGHVVPSVGYYDTKSEGRFVVTAGDSWFAEASLTKVVDTPKAPTPVKPTSVTLKIGNRNVIMRRYTPSGKNPPFTNVKKGLAYFPDRVKLLATDVRTSGIGLLGTQEAGTYEAGDQLCDAIEAADKRAWSNILHGDNAGDITQGIHWDESIYKLLSEGKVDLTGTDHDWLVWARLQIIATGEILWYGVLHCEWHAGGTSTKGNQYDKKRETQVDEALKALVKMAKPDDIIVVSGDFNSSLQNAYDGPGKAAVANGFIDAEHVAVSQVNTEYNSYHGDGTPPKHDSQLDRFLVLKSQVDSGRIKVTTITVRANSSTIKGSDHYQVDIALEVTTKK